MQSQYASKPTRYLAHLLGHEGAGSVLALLKKRGWANGLGSYCYASTSAFACFCVNVELTDVGKAHTDAIAAAVFSYIGTYWLDTLYSARCCCVHKCVPRDASR